MNKLIGTNEFVKRQTPQSKFAHYDGTWEELEDLVEICVKDPLVCAKDPLTDDFSSIKYNSCMREGYRKGVVLVNICPHKFYSSIVELKEGDEFKSVYKPRRPGETPYIQSVYNGKKSHAVFVEIVLYSHEVLLETKENSTNLPWEIISINAFPDKTSSPMPPETEARNILCLDGGTNPKLEDKTKEELIAYIRNMAKSIMYWNSHVCVTPQDGE